MFGRKKQFYGSVSGTGKPKNRLLLFTGIVVLLLIGAEVGQELWREYKIKNDIESLKKDITKYESDNNDLEKMLEYYKTLSYKEKSARMKLNLQKPGEKVIIVDGAEDTQKIESADGTSSLTTPSNNTLSNAKKWWDYFFGQK